MANSLLFSMLVKMDAGQAKAELAAFTAAMDKMGKEVGDLPAKVRPAKDAVGDLGSAYMAAGDESTKAGKVIAAASLAVSRAELLRLKSTDGAAQEDIAAAQAAYNKAKALDAAASAALAVDRANVQMAGTANNLGRANQAAAGSVANLVANFNDVGVMIAAGQNPLQLAIQQGTQISQVIGPMGAAGAMKALGSAFVGMLNPINLVTFAVIAGGAAFVQWAMSGEDAADSVAEKFKDVEAAIVDVKDKIATITFGETNVSVARLLGDMDGISAQIEVINQKWRETDSLGQRQRYAEEANLLKAQYAEMEKVVQAYREAVAEKKRLEDRSTAQDMLADLKAEAELNAVIAEFGAQSAQATALRAEQERAAFVEKAKSLDISDQLRLELVAAFDAASAIASVDMSSGIAAAANSAATLARNLGVSVDVASKMMANGFQAKQPVVFDPRDPRYDEGVAFRERARLGVLNKPIDLNLGTSGRSAGAGAAKAQTDSVAKLIEKLQAELDISRELDPVQREMAQYRDQMAKATDAEAEQVRALIRLREEEKQKTQALEYIQNQTGDALIDGLMGAADAGERLIDTLMRAAAQAVILGEGPLAQMFGGGTGLVSGLFNGLFGGGGGGGTGAMGLPMPFASGGMIYGAGGPRDDLVPVMASPGEFMVNARATQRHRALLEQINSGQLDRAPAFADGGMLGGGAASGMAGGAGIVFNAHFDLRGAQGDDAVRAAAKEGMDAALREFARADLPRHMRRISGDPSVVRF